MYRGQRTQPLQIVLFVVLNSWKVILYMYKCIEVKELVPYRQCYLLYRTQLMKGHSVPVKHTGQMELSPYSVIIVTIYWRQHTLISIRSHNNLTIVILNIALSSRPHRKITWMRSLIYNSRIFQRQKLKLNYAFRKDITFHDTSGCVNLNELNTRTGGCTIAETERNCWKMSQPALTWQKVSTAWEGL